MSDSSSKVDLSPTNVTQTLFLILFGKECQIYNRWVCEDVNECDDGAACPEGATCQNKKGSYSCQCPAGLYWDQTLNSCQDENECLSENTCDLATEQCLNEHGSYSCTCKLGRVRDTTTQKCELSSGEGY